jgi:hypothetical protein
MVKVFGKYGVQNKSAVCYRCLGHFTTPSTGKAVPILAIKACKGSGGIAPLILNLGTRRR